MDFARKQLEKYGWIAGKGLGKHENGISEALKPKLKRSVAGVGHDAAADFTEHWWNDLYNKAAKNLEVENKSGKTRRIKRKDSSDFEITNNSWEIKNRKKGEKSDDSYTNFFVKTAILSNDGSKVEHLKGNDVENETIVREVFKMTDAELFAACKGRTAHKGARHGLKALGKLARIEQQEQILLNQDKYNGYSHKKVKSTDQVEQNDQIVENNILDSNVDSMLHKIKKKKKKRSQKDLEEKGPETNGNELNDDQFKTIKFNKKEKETHQPEDNIVDVKKKKLKKSIKVHIEDQCKKEKENCEDRSDVSELTLDDLFPDHDGLDCESIVRPKKKRKKE